jgi:dTDP-4-dehydrorhamnose 3,5-epimerase
MKVQTKEIQGVLVLEPTRHEDDRGFFVETWNAGAFADAGIETAFVQDNQSFSRQAGTVRGLHCQAPPHAQAKLLRVGCGRIYDVAVDIRQGSPTYGQWVGEELSADNGRQLYIAEGFLHGFMTLDANTEVLYKCSAPYAPECEFAVKYDDEQLAIAWPEVDGVSNLSDKDSVAPSFEDLVSPFVFEAAGAGS